MDHVHFGSAGLKRQQVKMGVADHPESGVVGKNHLGFGVAIGPELAFQSERVICCNLYPRSLFRELHLQMEDSAIDPSCDFVFPTLE